MLVFAVIQRVLLATTQLAPVDGVAPENGIYVHFLGAPLDDVFIHCRYASNLQHGFSYSFNPGETLTADTSPFWVLLLALIGLFSNHLELVAIGISLLCYLLIPPAVYRTARDIFSLSETHARLAGWATVFASRLAWSGMSGMETSLASLLMFLTIEEHIRSRQRKCLRVREALWLGLGLLTRPEFLFVAAVLAADWVYAGWKREGDVRAASLVFLVCASIAAPGYLLPLITRNSILAHSSVVQGASLTFAPPLHYAFHYAWRATKVVASNNILLFALAGLGLAVLRKEPMPRLLLVIAVGLPLLQAIFAPQERHHVRYLFPILPLYILSGSIVWTRLTEQFQIRHWVRIAVPILILLGGILETSRWAYISGSDVRNINDQHLAIAHWLGENMRPNDTLAVDDVGVFGYVSRKHLIDLTGLITPSIFPLEHDQDSVWQASRRMGANLFIIYKELNPELYNRHKDSLSLEREFQVRLPHTSAAAIRLCIFRLKEPPYGP